jgi:hypothetical protein
MVANKLLGKQLKDSPVLQVITVQSGISLQGQGMNCLELITLG